MQATEQTKMKVEVWSDIMCPFCYIGKRNYESAIARFEDKNNIELVWKSFQLDPSIPEDATSAKNVYQYLSERKGMSYEQSVKMHENVVQMAKNAGLEYNFDKAIVTNSFKAHRLIQLAKSQGLGDAVEERLFKAYFTDGEDLGREEVLVKIGTGIGLKEEDIKTALVDSAYAAKVQQDVWEAQSIGVTGVPFFVFDRKYAVSGAQPAEAFLQTLQRSVAEWKKEQPLQVLTVADGASCVPGEDCV